MFRGFGLEDAILGNHGVGQCQSWFGRMGTSNAFFVAYHTWKSMDVTEIGVSWLTELQPLSTLQKQRWFHMSCLNVTTLHGFETWSISVSAYTTSTLIHVLFRQQSRLFNARGLLTFTEKPWIPSSCFSPRGFVRAEHTRFQQHYHLASTIVCRINSNMRNWVIADAEHSSAILLGE